jgi:hypothetical protein
MFQPDRRIRNTGKASPLPLEDNLSDAEWAEVKAGDLAVEKDGNVRLIGRRW